MSSLWQITALFCFHSLQTGNWIASQAIQDGVPSHKLVSIPFKRNGKLDRKLDRASKRCHVSRGVSIPFKRERADKGQIRSWWQVARRNVSIPFKRESGSQVQQKTDSHPTSRPVSIPFKRESGSQAFILKLNPPSGTCFNSLQTGKRIASWSC